MTGRPRIVVAAVALVALLLGVGVATRKAGDRARAEASSVVLTTGQANAAILAWADVPTTWRALWDPNDQPAPSETGGACNGPNSLARAAHAGAVATAGTAWAKSATRGPGVSEWVYAFADTAHAMAFMTASRQAFADCPSWTTKADNGDRVTITAKRAPFTRPASADDAYRLSITEVHTSDGRTVFRGVSDELHLRQGNHAYVVTTFGSGNNLTRLEHFRAIASRKLAQVLRVAPTLAPNQSHASIDTLRIAFVSAGGNCPNGRQRKVVHARAAMDCSNDTVLVLYRSAAERDTNLTEMEGSLLVGPNWVLNTTPGVATTVQPGMGGEIRTTSPSSPRPS